MRETHYAGRGAIIIFLRIFSFFGNIPFLLCDSNIECTLIGPMGIVQDGGVGQAGVISSFHGHDKVQCVTTAVCLTILPKTSDRDARMPHGNLANSQVLAFPCLPVISLLSSLLTPSLNPMVRR